MQITASCKDILILLIEGDEGFECGQKFVRGKR